MPVDWRDAIGEDYRATAADVQKYHAARRAIREVLTTKPHQTELLNALERCHDLLEKHLPFID
jgi:uncharacterized protein HemY